MKFPQINKNPSVITNHFPFFLRERNNALFGNGSPFFTKNSTASSSVQTKLSINQPNDQYEQEADAVVNHPSATRVVQKKKISSIQRLTSANEEERLSTRDAHMRKDKEVLEKSEIQRRCVECEKEKEKGIQRMTMPEEKKEEGKMVQQKAEGATTIASPSLSSRIESAAGKGKPLPSKTGQKCNPPLVWISAP